MLGDKHNWQCRDTRISPVRVVQASNSKATGPEHVYQNRKCCVMRNVGVEVGWVKGLREITLLLLLLLLS